MWGTAAILLERTDILEKFAKNLGAHVPQLE